MIPIPHARLAISFFVALILSACASIEDLGPEFATAAIPPSNERPQDEPLALGKLHYIAGGYGLSERYYRAAVEANPNSSEAWLGLAASYDRLRRFDLAERAYDRLLRVEGRSVAVLNNLAYHHMLRGNLGEARVLLFEAARIDPFDLLVQGNLRLLETWKQGGPEEAFRG